MKKVYTPGVWDILHFGHINLIELAKSYGDHLTVGVCSDKTVITHGKNPIVNENDRKKLICALKAVDNVVIYDNPDQLDQLKDLNVFVIGEEFGSQGVPEHKIALEYCKNNNIEVIRIPRTPDVSSSKIKEQITKSKEQKIKQFWDNRAKLDLNLAELTSFTKNSEERKNKDLQFILKAIEKSTSQKNTLLELGCGVGRITLELQNLYKTIYASDYVEKFIEIAKTKNTKINFFCADAEDFDNSINYDCCLISGMLLHLSDEKISKILNKLNSSSIIVKESIGTFKHYELPDGHYSEELKCNYTACYRTVEEIIQIFKKYNYILKYTELIDRHREETHLQVFLFEIDNPVTKETHPSN